MTRRHTRRAVLVAGAVALAGCNGEAETPTETATGESLTDETPSDATPSTTGTPANPALGDVQQRGDLRLTSSAFADGERIPDRYGRDGENANPPLSVQNVPDDAETLTLIVDDPDAVAVGGEVFLHWLVWNIPATTTDIPEGWDPEGTVGTNDFGNRRYDGPAPPDGEHTYRFKLYALDTSLDVSQSASKEEVGEAMNGHVLAQTQLTGTFAP